MLPSIFYPRSSNTRRLPAITLARCYSAEDVRRQLEAMSVQARREARPRAGRTQLAAEEAQWQRASRIVDRFFSISEDLS